MSTNCIHLSETDYKNIKNAAIKLGNTIVSKTSKQKIEFALSKRSDLNLDTIDLSFIKAISEIIEEEQNIKQEADKLLADIKKEGFKIHGATVIKEGTYKKSDPYNNKEDLYLFGENLQAHLAIHEGVTTTIEGIITPNNGVITNVKNTAAIVRTDNSGVPYENARGIVVKKNAQRANNSYITKNAEDKKESIFTEDELKAFLNINRPIIAQIAQDLKEKKYTKIHLPDLALNNAGLPKALAEALNILIYEELNILGTVTKSEFGDDLYGITFGEINKPKSNTKNTKQTKEEVLESLAKERPVQLDIDKSLVKHKLLERIYPQIDIRRARIQFIAEFFKGNLNIFTDYLQESLQQAASERQLTKSENDTLTALKSGNEVIRKQTALAYTGWEGNISTSEIIISTIENFIKEASKYVIINEEGIPTVSSENYQNFLKYLENLDIFINNDYKNHSDKKKQTYVKNLLLFCKEVASEPDLFTALLDAASSIIEHSSNIKLSIDKSKMEEASNKLEEMENEEHVENRAELYLVKQKLVDPKTTLSARVKRLIGQCYKVKRFNIDKEGNKTIEYEYSSLGTKIPLQEGVVYYALMKRYATMNNEADFLRITEDIVKENPWFSEIADMIKTDTDLRNEFYRNFRKIAQIFTVITSSGRIQSKNAELDATAVVDMVTKNYEGCNILSEDSLYNSEGSINGNTIAKWKKATTAQSKVSNKVEFIKEHPIAWVISILNKDISDLNNVKDLITVYQILSGKPITVITNANEDTKVIEELPTNIPKVTLNNILTSMGIDTEDINLNILLPIDDTTLQRIMPSEEDEISEENRIQLNVDTMNALWPPLVRENILKILIGMQIIASNIKADSNLINNFRSTYVSIGSALIGITDGYTQASFYFNGNQRYSYTNPDKISQFIGIVNKTNTEEEIAAGTEYLIKNYLDYTLYTKSPLLKLLIKDIDTRKNLSRKEVLAIQTDPKASDIANVSDDAFLEGLICAYFNKTRVKEGLEYKFYSYYRNPLFSDSEVLNLFRLPSEEFITEGDKSKIINKLVSILDAEITRILDFEGKNKNEKIKITNYNKGKANAGKFCFFPFLEPKKTTILNYITNLNNNINTYEEEKQKYLYSILEEALNTFNEDFINSFSEIQKLKLYDRIKGINEANEKAETKQQALSPSFDTSSYFDEDPSNDIDVIEGDLEVESYSQNNEEIKNKTAQVDLWLTEFYFNDYYMQAELIMLLGGDLAYYKDVREFIKRNKQSYASGEKIWSLKEDGTPWKEKAVYLKDKEIVSNTFQSIQQLLNKSNMTNMEKDLIAGYLRPYTNINSTDGQGLRSLKSIKRIFKAMGGTWTSGLEEAFNKIERGEPDFDCWVNLINAIKPFMFTSEKKVLYAEEGEAQQRTEKVMVQHKNSEYLISALFSTLNTALNKSPELRALQTFMDLHDIDVIQFDSCVKVGGFNSLDLNFAYENFKQEHPTESFSEWYNKNLDSLTKGNMTQEEFNTLLEQYSFTLDNEDKIVAEVKVINTLENKADRLAKLRELQKANPRSALLALEVQMANIGEIDTIHELPMEDFMLAQPNTDHLTDAEALIGSQLKNIIIADLPEGFTIPITIGNKTFNIDKKTAIALYDALFVDTILDNFNKLNLQFANPESVQTMLMSAMESNPKYDGDIRNAFELNKSKTGFVMPMNSPIINNKAQDLILSRFKNNIQRQKIDGGNAVLVSNFSLSDNLHVQYKYKTDENGNKIATAVDYIPCYLPAMWKDVYTDYLEEVTEGTTTYWTINFDKVRDNNAEELFNIIGYRIPTEDKYSIMPIRIVGFLPVQAGASIMLPNDIITMSGTDFDIDKLFIMRKSFRRELAPFDLASKFGMWILGKQYTLTEEENSLWTELQKIEKSKKGFTATQLRDLVNTYPIFAQFIDETDFLYENVKYVIPKVEVNNTDNIVDISKLDTVSNFEDRRHLRNNMLIDMCWSILTSSEGSTQMMTPATYINVKLSSNREIIMNDPILLKVFYDKYYKPSGYNNIYEALTNFAEVYKNPAFSNTLEGNVDAMQHFIDTIKIPDNPLDISFYIQSHRNLMDGNGLIGGLAVNSSRHYKFQLCTKEDNTSKVTIKKDFQFNINIPGYGEHTISQIDPRISPITGRPIGRDASQLQAASPDNGKDPRLGNMGISMKSLGQTNFMNSVGIPIETIGFLNRLGDILSVGRTYMNNNKEFIKNFNLQKFTLDIGDLSNVVTKYRLGEDLNNNELELIASFVLWWNNILDISRDLRKASVYVRADSPNGALPTNTTEVIQYLLKIKDLQQSAKQESFTLDGLDTVIDLNLDYEDYQDKETFRNKLMNSNIPRLQAWYSCGIKSAISLVDTYLPEISTPILKALEYLQFLTRYDLSKVRNQAIIRTFLNEITTYMLSTNTLFSDKGLGDTGDILNTRNYYIHDFPIKYKKFLEERNEDGTYKYADIRNLTLIKMMTNNNKKGIKFKNVGGKISIDSRQYLMECLDTMLRDERKEVSDFAVDLFMYSYFDNGLNFGHSNFGIFFSIAFVRSMNGFVAAMQKQNENIKNGSFNFKRFIHQLLLNHPNYIPYIKSSNSNNLLFNDSNKTVTIPINASDEVKQTILGYNSINDEIGAVRPFIRISRKYKNAKNKPYTITKLYTIQSVNSASYTYVEVDYNTGSTTDRIPFYDASKDAIEIKWNDLQSRGAVTALPKKSKKNNSGQEEDTIEPEESELDVINVAEDTDKIAYTPEESEPEGFNAKTSEGLSEKQEEQLAETAKIIDEEPEWVKVGIEVFGSGYMKDNVTGWTSSSTEDLSDFIPTKDPENDVCGAKGTIDIKEVKFKK